MSRSRRPRCPGGRTKLGCYVCQDSALEWRQRRYALGEADMHDEEVQVADGGYHWQRNGYLDFLVTEARERLMMFQPDPEPPTDPRPLSAPLRAHVQGRAGGLEVLLRLSLLWLAAAFLAACEPPAWRPGDPPLRIEASDAAWPHVLAGCMVWAQTGLTCERVTHDATVEVIVRPIKDGLHGLAKCRFEADLGGVRTAFYLSMAPEVIGQPHGDTIAAHELGHLLGIWDHVPYESAPWALMIGKPITFRDAMPSQEDLQALADAWGVEVGSWR